MKKLLLVFAATAMLGACKKDSEPAPATASRTDLLTAHRWKPSAGTVTFSATGNSSTADAFEDCDKDDAYTFNADKSLVADAGTMKCNTSDPQKETGSWALSSNDQKLTVNLPNQAINGDLDVKELTATTLHLYASQAFNGGTVTIDATFVAY